MERVASVLLAIGLVSACGSRDDAQRRAAAAHEAAQTKAAQARAEIEAADLERRAAALKAEAAALKGHATEYVNAHVDPARARAIAAAAKAELDKVYQSTSDYDLDVTTAAATTAHAEKLAAMPHVTVGDLTVGYEEASGVSVTGTSSKRHFRATWRRGDRDVIVGYQTQSNLDLVAFARLLPKLVPIVEKLL